jgi:hypothetical protein
LQRQGLATRSCAKSCLQQFKGAPKHTFLLHVKEYEFRFNQCYEHLPYNEAISEVVARVCDALPNGFESATRL